MSDHIGAGLIVTLILALQKEMKQCTVKVHLTLKRDFVVTKSVVIFVYMNKQLNVPRYFCTLKILHLLNIYAWTINIHLQLIPHIY